jgi:hypothetical protein
MCETTAVVCCYGRHSRSIVGFTRARNGNQYARTARTTGLPRDIAPFGMKDGVVRPQAERRMRSENT